MSAFVRDLVAFADFEPATGVTPEAARAAQAEAGKASAARYMERLAVAWANILAKEKAEKAKAAARVRLAPTRALGWPPHPLCSLSA